METLSAGLFVMPFEPFTTFEELEKQCIWESAQSIRKTAQFGYSYNFKTRSCTKTTPFTDIIRAGAIIAQNLAKKCTGQEIEYNQCIVNLYERGQLINAHVDAPIFGDTITVLCFGTEIMEFKRGVKKALVEIGDGQAYVMTNEARYGWAHALKFVRDRRISVTYRTV